MAARLLFHVVKVALLMACSYWSCQAGQVCRSVRGQLYAPQQLDHSHCQNV